MWYNRGMSVEYPPAIWPLPVERVRMFLNKSLVDRCGLRPEMRSYTFFGPRGTAPGIASTTLNALAALLVAASRGGEAISYDDVWHSAVQRRTEELREENKRKFRQRLREDWNSALACLDPGAPTLELPQGARTIPLGILHPFVLARVEAHVYLLLPPELVVTHVGGKSKHISLDCLAPGQWGLVGRASADSPPDKIALDLDPYLSRRHCEILLEGSRLRVRAVEARHPLLHRGREASEFTLEPGEEFRTVDLTFRLVARGGETLGDATPLHPSRA